VNAPAGSRRRCCAAHATWSPALRALLVALLLGVGLAGCAGPGGGASTNTDAGCAAIRVEPNAIMSWLLSCGCSIRVLFTYVPFDEPMSSSHTPSRRGSNRACRLEEYSSSGSDTSSAIGPPPNSLAQLRGRLLMLLNEHRAAQGLPPLVLDPIACRAAQVQAEEMERSGLLRHTDLAGQSPRDRFVSLGGDAPLYAENIGYSGLRVDDFSSQWATLFELDADMMQETAPADGHRENILSADYNALGVGVAMGSHGLYMAEDFVGRASRSLSAR